MASNEIAQETHTESESVDIRIRWWETKIGNIYNGDQETMWARKCVYVCLREKKWTKSENKIKETACSAKVQEPLLFIVNVYEVFHPIEMA